MRRIDTLVIHHSASRSGSVEQFRKEHIHRLGAHDIGYHAVIGNGNGIPSGHIKPGRPEAEEGAGVWGNNHGKLHVCCVGNFHSVDKGYTGKPSFDTLFALGHWLIVKSREVKERDGKYPLVRGHKEIALPGHSTACPGDQMPLARIRVWLTGRLAGTSEIDLPSFLGVPKPPPTHKGGVA